MRTAGSVCATCKVARAAHTLLTAARMIHHTTSLRTAYSALKATGVARALIRAARHHSR
jgi:hypothetical protein